jgi:hypothetical protein
MFETLVVSREVVRLDGRAGIAALLFHLLVLALAMHQRAALPSRVPPSGEPIRIAFSRAASPPAPARRSQPPMAPSPIVPPKDLKIPALPAPEAFLPTASLDFTRIVPANGRALTVSPALIATLDEAADISGPADVDHLPRLAAPLDPAYPPAL